MFTIQKIENYLENLNKKLPPLTEYYKINIVNYLPYLSLVVVIFFGISFVIRFISPYPFGNWQSPMLAINQILNYLLTFIVIITFFNAYSPLKRKVLSGWRSLFYLNWLLLIVSMIGGLIEGFSYLILSILFFYILFQIKTKYY